MNILQIRTRDSAIAIAPQIIRPFRHPKKLVFNRLGLSFASLPTWWFLYTRMGVHTQMYVHESGMLSIHTQLLQDQVVKFYTSFYSSKKRWHDYLLEFQSCGFFFVNFCKFLLRHTQNSIFFIRSRFTGFPIFLTQLYYYHCTRCSGKIVGFFSQFTAIPPSPTSP